MERKETGREAHRLVRKAAVVTWGRHRMSSLVTGNMKYIRAPFVANIRPGHRVLILSDFSSDQRVWQVVQATCAELGADVTVALFERRPPTTTIRRRRCAKRC
jgi:hypothetical protein